MTGRSVDDLSPVEEVLAFRKFLALKGAMADEFSSCLCGHFDDCHHGDFYGEIAALMKKWMRMGPPKRRAWLQYEVSDDAAEIVRRAARRFGVPPS